MPRELGGIEELCKAGLRENAALPVVDIVGNERGLNCAQAVLVGAQVGDVGLSLIKTHLVAIFGVTFRVEVLVDDHSLNLDERHRLLQQSCVIDTFRHIGIQRRSRDHVFAVIDIDKCRDP